MVPKSCFHVAYVCIVYTDVSNVHYQTIYCEKSTVEETGHFIITWTRITRTFMLSLLIMLLASLRAGRREKVM